jgi:hypothetical protein
VLGFDDATVTACEAKRSWRVPACIASAVGTSIHTEADSLEQLQREIRDAVHCHFLDGVAPPLIRLQHGRQSMLAL